MPRPDRPDRSLQEHAPRRRQPGRASRRQWMAALALVLVHGAAAAVPESPRATPRVRAPELVSDFYEAREHALAWQASGNYGQLLEAIDALAAHGLTPAHYHRETLDALAGNPVARERIATDAWLSAALHLLQGKLDPQRIEPAWTAPARQADLVTLLETALTHGRVRDALLALAPTHPEYRRLHETLAALLASEDEAPADAAPVPSRAAAGGPAPSRDERIARLRANLERWRWLPADLGRRHVRVNIADFAVSAYESGARVRRHRAIVGRTYRKTPVFSNRIRYIVLNPWWETPPSLAARDELELFRRDPGAPQRLGFQVLDQTGRTVDPATIDWQAVPADRFPYRLRQAPGPLNVLGRAKIMFPNPHNVYLHGTAAPELFERDQRTFSSGCVRTQDVLDLVRWLLAETPQWDDARIDAALDGWNETTARLAEPVDVHVLYFTAVPDEHYGSVRYLADIYERDTRVLAALDRPPSP